MFLFKDLTQNPEKDMNNFFGAILCINENGYYRGIMHINNLPKT